MKKLMLLGLVYLLVHIPYQKYLPVTSLTIPLISEKEASLQHNGHYLFFTSEEAGSSLRHKTHNIYKDVTTRFRNIFNSRGKIHEIRLKAFGFTVRITSGNDSNNKQNH